MSDQPSWMPSDEEISRAMGLDLIAVDGFQSTRRLIERAALKAQVEALTSPMREHDWDGWRCSAKCPACNALSSIRARLAELEASDA